MGRTRIDWCNETINPFTGCRNGCAFTGCRNGCAYCYARRMAYRLAHIDGTVYQRVGRATSGSVGRFIHPTGGNHFAPAFHMDVLERERRRLGQARTPRRVFIGSMGDMCFEGESLLFDQDGERCGLFSCNAVQQSVARFCAEDMRHTFLLLTKRPDLLANDVEWARNVHLGVSVTGNADLYRLPALLRWADNLNGTPLGPPGVLWASVEPLQGPGFDTSFLAGLGWIVIGAQTGAGARAPSAAVVDAAKDIVYWGKKQGVPVFVKGNLRQHGGLCGPRSWPRELPGGAR